MYMTYIIVYNKTFLKQCIHTYLQNLVLHFKQRITKKIFTLCDLCILFRILLRVVCHSWITTLTVATTIHG